MTSARRLCNAFAQPILIHVRRVIGGLAVIAAVLAAGSPARAASSVMLPPVGAVFDYQIGGAYRPAAAVRIVDRDRTDRPAPGRYDICYVNAFQTQPQEIRWWRTHHRNLLLHDANGHEVVDRDWGETLLDTSTAHKRAALAGIVDGWVDGCARHGFDAIEYDNLDSYTRSQRLLTAADAIAYARLLTRHAHLDHVAAAQKNAAELSTQRVRTSFDFAIAEECQVYAECGSYTRAYGRHLIEIEYPDNPLRYFRAACAARGDRVSIELVDRDVLPAGQDGHIRRWC